MFSGKVLFAAAVALCSMVDMASAAATAKADCWRNPDCTGVLKRYVAGVDGHKCKLPPSDDYPNPMDADYEDQVEAFLGMYTIAYLMGAPEDFCGNRKSIHPDIPWARIEALSYCFEIGAASACIWGECPDGCITEPPKVWGDPHFQLWNGEGYDFHGICDLLFLESKSHNLTVHIRTTQKFHYSYVSSAAVELNGEVMEFGSWGSVIQNGMYEHDDEELPKTFGGFELVKEVSNKKTHTYLVTLADGFGIEFKSYKDMVGVKVIGSRKAFADSRGLMGSAVTGEKVGRDGVTIFTDNNEFGQEWQVLEDEPKLFEAVREPQAPRTCRIPEGSLESRRLGESLAREEAEEACRNWHMNKEACISDVLLTGDAELAKGVY